jgi:hypothetical protein
MIFGSSLFCVDINNKNQCDLELKITLPIENGEEPDILYESVPKPI